MIAAISRFVIQNRIMLFSIAGILLLIGLGSWSFMPKAEDPSFPERYGMITVVLPGGTTEEVERLLVTPVEQELSELDEVKKVDTIIRPELGIVNIELIDSVSTSGEIAEAWKTVEDAMGRAKQDFPDSALPPVLDKELNDQESIILALRRRDNAAGRLSDAEWIAHLDAAEAFERVLTGVETVSKVKIIGSPEREVAVRIPDEAIVRLGTSYEQLRLIIQESSRTIPAGSVVMDGRNVYIGTNAGFSTIDEIRALPVPLASGETVTLGSIARVTLGPEQPLTQVMLHNGAQVLGLGVVPKKGIDVFAFQRGVASARETFERSNPGYEVITVNSQPEYVDARLKDLFGNLVQGIAVVGLVLLLGLGIRNGLLAAVMVPVISIVSLGIFAISGGELNQISIAAFVMALGMLIDNVIVVLESIQEKIDAGASFADATAAVIREFLLPLAAATGTTLAAFVPMLAAQGGTADFTRAIPVVAIITLTTSYFFAILITPNLAGMVLKPGTARKMRFLDGISLRAGTLAVRHPWKVIIAILALTGIFGAGFMLLDKKFFPSADRDQLVIDIRLPEGAHLSGTRQAAERLYAAMVADPVIKDGIVDVTAFVGRSTPQFYYNLTMEPDASHLAQMMVRLKSADAADALRIPIAELARTVTPEALVIVRKLEQGDPIAAPIEVKIAGGSPEAMAETAERVLHAASTVPGITDSRITVGVGVLSVRYDIDDASALQYGQTRSSVTAAILARTRGIEAGQYRAANEPVPIILRSAAGEVNTPESLSRSVIAHTMNQELRVGDLAHVREEWQRSLMYHENGRRTVFFLAEVADGYAPNTVLAAVRDRIHSLGDTGEVRISFGGDQEASAQANLSLLRAMPAGIILLVFSLLAVFRSYKKIFIILTTAPLGLAFIVPGLALSGSSFGFLAMIGSLTLVGIVVNNGILLIDYIESQEAKGVSIEEAVRLAVARRIRPIVLTTSTTIVGLIPLALSSSTLWPPFAWSIISGLFFATLLTLLFVPVQYLLIFRRGKKARTSGKKKAAGALMIAVAAFVSVPLLAGEPESITLRQAIDRSAANPDTLAAAHDAAAARSGYHASLAGTYAPKIGASVEKTWLDRQLKQDTPFGEINAGKKSFVTGSVYVQQNLLAPADMAGYAPQYAKLADAKSSEAAYQRKVAQYSVIEVFAALHELKASRDAALLLRRNLESQSAEMRRLYNFGRVSEADLFKVTLTRDANNDALKRIDDGITVTSLEFGRLLGSRESLSAAPFLFDDQMELPDAEAAVNEALTRRDDYRAFTLVRDAKERERRALYLENLPTVYARGSWQYSSNGEYTDSSYLAASIGANVDFMAGGTSIPRIRAASEELEALRIRESDLRARIALQVKDSMQTFLRNRAEYASRKAQRSAAERAVYLDRQRYFQGKTTLSDLLDAELLLRDRTQEAERARISVCW